jgi:hypothetical protein
LVRKYFGKLPLRTGVYKLIDSWAFNNCFSTAYRVEWDDSDSKWWVGLGVKERPEGNHGRHLGRMFVHQVGILDEYFPITKQSAITIVKWNQLVNPATSSPADHVHNYVIPPKLLLTNRFYFQQTSVIHAAPVGRRKGRSLSGRSPAPIADNIHVATISREHSVLNLREINRNSTHTALASVLTYYGWVSLIF